MKTSVFRFLYAVNPTTKAVIDCFNSVKELHGSMKARNCKKYEVLYYYEMAENGYIHKEDNNKTFLFNVVATGLGSTMRAAKTDLVNNLFNNCTSEEITKYLKLLKL